MLTGQPVKGLAALVSWNRKPTWVARPESSKGAVMQQIHALSPKLQGVPHETESLALALNTESNELNESNWERLADGSMRFVARSETQTLDIARRTAHCLSAGDVIALIGDLGAGKTRFAKAIAEGLGVPADHVNSPTFTLIHEYEGRLPIRHCDTYRLRSAEEFADLGLDELFAPDGIALVEWADRVEEYLPRDRLEVRFGIDSPTDRTIDFVAKGPRSRRILAQFT